MSLRCCLWSPVLPRLVATQQSYVAILAQVPSHVLECSLASQFSADMAECQRVSFAPTVQFGFSFGGTDGFKGRDEAMSVASTSLYSDKPYESLPSQYTGSQPPSPPLGGVRGMSPGPADRGAEVAEAPLTPVPSGQPNPSTPLLNAAQLLKNIEGGSTQRYLTDAAGFPLTEDNVKSFQALLKGQQSRVEPESMEDFSEAEQKRASLYKDAINGHFEARSYLGNLFRGEHKVGTPKGDAFKKMNNRVDQATFKKQWAELKLKEMVEKKTHTRTWARVDRTKGRYRNLGRLVTDYGGWHCAEALEGACTAASKCTLLGEPWVMVHPQNGMTEYLVLEIEFEEEFTQMWSHFKEFFNTSSGALADGTTGTASTARGAGAGAVKDAAGAGKQAAIAGKQAALQSDGDAGVAGQAAGQKKSKGRRGEEKAQPEPKVKKLKGGKNDEEPASPEEKKKKDLQQLMKDATKLKGVFHEASSNYVHIIANIQGNTDWDWAKDNIRTKKLQGVQSEVKGLLNAWHREFLANDIATMKKKYTVDRLSVELSSFVAAKEKIENLAGLIVNMNVAHDAVMAIGL